ncbi:MAG: 3-hydroxyacyl-[acyl-carrier-protein] dehydratase FabZ [Fibrobacteria bacterium]|jgi:3-hydroxyacyl-[acyl-carrier-protein] dehydratase|nr:3-hydroxyacyl-[acyl-carrier-protein] dehydratase FabZ [Fibrobacteria bacterium]
MSEASPETISLSADAVLKAIPHRPPFLFVDSVPELEKGKRIRAIRDIRATDDYFAGHFPGEPVMPGVLQIEALAQALCILIAESFPEASAGKRPAFAGIEDVRFRKAVRPGDVLELNVELTQFRRGFATANAYASVGGEKVAEAVLKATMV